jgi:exodeoxyribonuclease V alpha subunit
VARGEDDARFGPQVQVDSAEPLGPTGEQAVLAYFKRVRHIGESRALRLLVRHPGDTLASVDRDPRKAFRAIGLRGKQVEEAVKSWDGLRRSRQLHLLLAPHGLAWLVARLQEHYGAEAHRVVQQRPYELTSVFGVGFTIADRIARGNGLPRTTRSGSRPRWCTCSSKPSATARRAWPVGEAARQAANVTGGEPPRSACSTSSSKTAC